MCNWGVGVGEGSACELPVLTATPHSASSHCNYLGNSAKSSFFLHKYQQRLGPRCLIVPALGDDAAKVRSKKGSLNLLPLTFPGHPWAAALRPEYHVAFLSGEEAAAVSVLRSWLRSDGKKSAHL